MARLSQLVIFTVILLAPIVVAEVPQLISYQGRITDSGENPVLDGDYEIIFGIYDVEFGGVPFWAETLSTVGVQNGLFNVILGSTTPFGGPAKKNAALPAYLGIKVGSDPEISPRTQLLSVPFAFDANRADTAQFSYNSQNAKQADTAFFAFGATWSDTAGYASGSHWSDSSIYAFSSLSADTSDHSRSVADGSIGTASIADGSIGLIDIGPNGAADGQIIKWNSSLSSWETVDDVAGTGDITSVIAGTGLTGGGTSGDVTLGIPTGGVNSARIQDGTIGPEDLSSFGATDGQMLKWNSSLVSWEVVDEVGDISSVTAGTGLTGGGASGDVSLSIPTGGVTSTHIQNGSVANADIATDAITSDKIAYLSITGSDIATGAINNAKILDGTIVSQDIADGQILTADIGNIQVTTEKIYPNAVTGSKVAASAITSSHVLDNSLTSDDLAANSVNSDEIAASAVGNSELANSAVSSNKIADNSVIFSKIANNAINSSKVMDNSLSDIDIVDEPGIAFAVDTANIAIPKDTWVTIGSQTINCPASGYLFASANTQFVRNNSIVQDTRFECKLVLDNSLSSSISYSHWYKDGPDISVQPILFVFPVVAGLHTVEVVGKNSYNGSLSVWHVDFALMYFPTAYGTVMPAP